MFSGSPTQILSGSATHWIKVANCWTRSLFLYNVGVSQVYLQRQNRCWCVSYSNLYHNKVISQISLIYCKPLLCTDKPDNCLCHNLVSKCNPPLARHCLDLFPDIPILNKQDFVRRFFTERNGGVLLSSYQIFAANCWTSWSKIFSNIDKSYI